MTYLPLKISEDLYFKAEEKRQYIKNYTETSDKGSLNNYVIVLENKETRDSLNSPCYANLKYFAIGDKKVIFFIDWSLSRKSKELLFEGSKTYLNKAITYLYWLVNDSIFSDVFVTKDPKEIISGGAIFHTHYPANFVVQAATAVRYIGEFSEIIKIWYKFKDYINKDAALFLAHSFSLSNKEYFFTDYIYNAHYFMENKDLNRTVLRNFMNKKLNQEYISMYYGKLNFYPMMRLFREENKEGLRISINKKFINKINKTKLLWGEKDVESLVFVKENMDKWLPDMLKVNLGK